MMKKTKKMSNLSLSILFMSFSFSFIFISCMSYASNFSENELKKLSSQEREELKKFWHIKIELAKENIKNRTTYKYIPKDVLFDKKHGIVVYPVNNAMKKVFDDTSPLADKDGMVEIPNIDEAKENEKITQAEKHLNALSKII